MMDKGRDGERGRKEEKFINHLIINKDDNKYDKSQKRMIERIPHQD